MSPLDQLYCRIQFRQASYQGEFTPPEVDKPYIEYPGYNGGSDWGSVAVDTDDGILIANYNDMPNYNQLLPREKADQIGFKSIEQGGGSKTSKDMGNPQMGSPYAISINAGWRLSTGLLCSEPPYGHIRAIDLRLARRCGTSRLAARSTTGRGAFHPCCRSTSARLTMEGPW